ncbi:hypothetical protein PFMALIP_03850 [Plasmodium falciparum MaliPS096_E11]|uniref:Dynein regulatory complex subunit 7 MORN domain-containing protein n=1 Tax=Plasmodium falciparum MaliPS096_E11 TaxID=1036727 RepID=A0A024WMC6_PLAFA|nr:hypothetical protein PFMALIP_03850 [Plasmodium falciparum MaliPS096_E11]
MKNKNKLKRCLDYLKNNKEEIIENYNNTLPSTKENVLLNYLKILKKKLQEKYDIQFCEFFFDEYGIKKNLCSSIIQIYFPFGKGNNYKEIYSLIKNYFTYEILLQRKIKTLLLPNVSLIFDWKVYLVFLFINILYFLKGREYDIYDCPYKSIFYLWNEKNIYININKTGDIQTLMSQIKNNEYFVPAFYEEIKNKSLTPIIENKFYVIRKDRFLLKYPQGSNIIFYKNCKKDDYGEFLQHDGLISMHTHYENEYYTSVDYIFKLYKHRRDRKTAKIYIPQNFKTIEYYDDCSHEFLKKFEQRMGFYSWFTFYLNRHDGLIYYFEIKDYKLMEYFINRNDNVIYRSVKLSQKIPTIYKLQLFNGKEYYVTKITVKYINKHVDNGVKKKVFLIPERKIIFVFYNNYNKISNTCEVYDKCIRYNEDIEEDEEVLIYKKHAIYKHYINHDDAVEKNMLYLLKEEVTFFEDIKYMYQNVICSIMKEKEDINKMEGEYQYMANNITNLSEIIYHDNEKINFFNKSLMEDNLNIYNFYKNYPWNDYLEISMKNDFFMSKNKMLQIENAPQEIDYVNSYQKIKKSNEIKKST